MARDLRDLLDGNRAWVKEVTREDPEFFARLSEQRPHYLWIGCSDSRVPANEIVGIMPGGMFVHRNVANVVVHTDLNCLSTIHFAVDVLRVGHIIVCGHYGCVGVRAALHRERLGLSDNWLRHVCDVHDKHRDRVDSVTGEEARHDRLCELNVVEQVVNVSRTTVVRDAWARGQHLTIHGVVYGLKDGLLRDLNMSVSSEAEATDRYAAACAGVAV